MVTIVKFQRTETVICELEVRDQSGALVDPATSVKVTITDPSGTVKVNGMTMDRTGLGKYHYDFNPAAGDPLGWYRVRYVVTDGSRVTVEDDGFELVA